MPVSSLSTENGYIVQGASRHPYADFITTAQSLNIDADAALKPASQFKYIGQETRRVDAIAKATGTAQFGIDVDVPGMHYAVVVRAPVAARRRSLSTRRTRAACPA